MGLKFCFKTLGIILRNIWASFCAKEAPIAQLGEHQTLDRRFDPHLGRGVVSLSKTL